MARELVNEPAIDPTQLLQALAEGVYGLDLQGRTTFLNAAAERLLGWPAADILGKRQHDVIHHTHRDGSSHPLSTCPIHQVLRTGQPRRVDDDVFIRKDGTLVDVEYTATPLYDNGSVVGAVVAFRDITEERRANREDERRQQLLTETQSIARLGSWEWDIENDHITWADETYRIFGMTPGQPLTLATYSERVHPDDAGMLRDVVGGSIASGDPYGIQHRIVLPDGSVREVSSRGHAIRDARGAVVKLRGIVQDITDRVEAEQRARALAIEAAARAEEAVDRERLHRILREAPAMICVTHGADHAIEMLNRRFEENLGSRYVIGLPIREAFQETSVGDLFFDLMDEVFASGEPYFGYQARSMRDDDGDGFPESEVYSDFVIQPIYAGAEVEGILLHAVDVTAQVHAQRETQRNATEMARSEARLRLALESGHMGTWEWDIAAARVDLSPPVERMYGLEPGAFGGSVEEFERGIHPDDRGRALSAINESIGAGEPLTAEYRIVTAGGEARWMESRGTLLRDEFGRAQRLMGVMLDVTERHEAEEALRTSREALRRSEEYYRFLANTIPPQVWTALPDGALDYVNDRVTDYFGAAGEQILGSGWATYVHPADLQATGERWTHSLRTGEPYNHEFRLKHRGGAWRWHLANATPMRGPDGAIARWFGTNADIDDQKRSLEAQQRLMKALERNNKELDQFAYVASHDLKAPLRGIANLSQWIEEEIGSGINDQAKEYLELLRGRIHRMEGLIEGILSYSRAGRAKEGAADVDVRALLDDILELAPPPEGTEVRIEGDMPVIHTERVPLQQVFMNLIGNALKYAGEGARVKVEAADAGLFHKFSVNDNGPGIAPEYHEKIWGIFQTLNPRDKVEGTGIGLALVRKIVEHKGGRAWIESDAGQGATFHFLWPKHEDSET
ncbi:MAG: PAS domain S-box protein [Acidobacteriota bacterium]|nr:PAS domain S-box protein [Acidobacteriota bacterium]